MRRFALSLAVVAWWLVLFGVFAQLPWRTPWRPAQLQRFDGVSFAERIGQGLLQGRGLLVTAGTDHSTLQTTTFPPLDAARWRVLRYAFDGLSRNQELTFVFRTAEQPEDVQTVSLPWPDGGDAAFDLARVPQWRGSITELGFAQNATAQLAPADLSVAPFTLVGAELQSASWRGAFAVKGTDWFGYWPWALMSISAIGPDSAAPRGRPLVAFVALGAAGSLALAALVLRWPRRRVVRAAALAAAAGWVALDLVWIVDLQRRHAATRDLYAGKAWEERALLVPDTELRSAAAEVRRRLAAAPPGLHVLVDAGADLERARMLYHLLPLNVGPANVAGVGTPQQRAGTLLVLWHVERDWRYDTSRRALIRPDGSAYAAESLHDAGDLRIYRFLAEAAP